MFRLNEPLQNNNGGANHFEGGRGTEKTKMLKNKYFLPFKHSGVELTRANQ